MPAERHISSCTLSRPPSPSSLYRRRKAIVKDEAPIEASIFSSKPKTSQLRSHQDADVDMKSEAAVPSSKAAKGAKLVSTFLRRQPSFLGLGELNTNGKRKPSPLKREASLGTQFSEMALSALPASLNKKPSRGIKREDSIGTQLAQLNLSESSEGKNGGAKPGSPAHALLHPKVAALRVT